MSLKTETQGCNYVMILETHLDYFTSPGRGGGVFVSALPLFIFHQEGSYAFGFFLFRMVSLARTVVPNPEPELGLWHLLHISGSRSPPPGIKVLARSGLNHSRLSSLSALLLLADAVRFLQ